MDSDPIITLKLMVDDSTKRVVFAESEKDFVDLILSFLTLPLSTLVRLVDQQSSLGSVDKLHRCVDDLESIPRSCKTMLMHPKNSATHYIEQLKLKISDPEPTRYYTCPCPRKRSSLSRFLSIYPGTRCDCGQEMTTELNLFDTKASNGRGVFVESGRYAIADDFFVFPLFGTTSVFEKFGIKDYNSLKEVKVIIRRWEALQLLKRSMKSTTIFTDVFMHIEAPETNPLRLKQKDNNTNTNTNKSHKQQFEPPPMFVKLFVGKGKLLYAEAKHDFVDLLLSFLTLPIGSIKTKLGDEPIFGCIDHLYKSVKELRSWNCLNEESTRHLLNPKTAECFGCKSQLIKFEEEPYEYYMHKHPMKPKMWRCRCLSTTAGVRCPCGNSMILRAVLADPRKYEESGGRFSSNSTTYMVTDELEVKPLSIASSLSLLKKAEGPAEEIKIGIGEKEALALLRASLTSRTALTDSFLSNSDAGSGGLKNPTTPSSKKLKTYSFPLKDVDSQLTTSLEEIKKLQDKIGFEPISSKATGLRKEADELKDQIIKASEFRAHTKKLKVDEELSDFFAKDVLQQAANWIAKYSKQMEDRSGSK